MKTKKRPLTEEEQDAINELVWNGWTRRAAEKEVRLNAEPQEDLVGDERGPEG